MGNNTKKMVAGIVSIVVLLAATLLIIKLPTEQPKFNPQRTFEFTNATKSSNSEKSDTEITPTTEKKYTIPKYTKPGSTEPVTTEAIKPGNTAQGTVPNEATQAITTLASQVSITTKATSENATTKKTPEVNNIKLSDTHLGRILKLVDNGLAKMLAYGRSTSVEEEFVTETIDFSVENYTDRSLPLGEKRIDQEGIYGEKVLFYKVHYSNGKEISRELISSQITKEPVNRIVALGSKEETTENPVTIPHDTTQDTTTTENSHEESSESDTSTDADDSGNHEQPETIIIDENTPAQNQEN